MSSPEQIDPQAIDAAKIETAPVEQEQTPEERERAETTRLFLENLERNLKIEIDPGNPTSEKVDLFNAGLVAMSMAGHEDDTTLMKAVGHVVSRSSAERAAISQQYVDQFILRDTLPVSLSEKTFGQAKIKPNGPEEQYNTWTGKTEPVNEYNYRRHSASPRGQLRLAQELVQLSAYQTLLASEKIPFGADKGEAALTPRQEAIVNGYERTLERIFEGNPSDPNSRVPERVRGVARETIRAWETDTKERLTAQPAAAPELPPVVEAVPAQAPEVTAEREARFLQKVMGALRDNPELTKQLGLATVDAVARVTGLKGYVDVPRYVIQRFAVRGFMGRGGIEAKMREALAAQHGQQAAIEKGEGQEAAEQRLEAAQAKLEKTMRYIRQDVQVEGQPGTYRELVQKILQEHADAAQSNRFVFEAQTKELLDRYTATKIDGVSAAREGLNSLLVASGAFGVRALTSGVLEIAQRSRAIEHERKMAGNEKPVDLMKDVIWGSAVKNYRELVHGGGQSTKGARNLTRAQAAMKIARWTGIAASVEGIGVGDMRIFDHVGTAAGNAWEVAKAPVSGVSRLIDGFTGKAEWGTIGHDLVNTVGGAARAVEVGAVTSMERIGHTVVANAQAAEHGVEAGWDWSMRQLGLSHEEGKAVLESTGVVAGAAAEVKTTGTTEKPSTAPEKVAPATKNAAVETPKPAVAETKQPTNEGARPERLTAQQIRERAQRNPEAFAKTLEHAQQTLGKQFPEVQKALEANEKTAPQQAPEKTETPTTKTSSPKDGRVHAEIRNTTTTKAQSPEVAPDTSTPRIETPAPIPTPEAVATPEEPKIHFPKIEKSQFGTATNYRLTDAEGHEARVNLPLPEGGRVDIFKEGHAEISVQGHKLFTGQISIEGDTVMIDYGRGPKELENVVDGLWEEAQRINRNTPGSLRTDIDAAGRTIDGAIDWLFGKEEE